jgi:CRISPR-associated protein Csm5
MTRWRLEAIALTPIHVGDGSQWTPEAYKLDGEDLMRFEPSAVLADMDQSQCQRYIAAIDKNNLQSAQGLLQQAAKADKHCIDRIACSPESEGEIKQAIGDPGRRRGNVHGFTRSGGKPFLPGSSVKGALRTAILSARAQSRLDELRRDLNLDEVEPGRSGEKSNLLQQCVLQSKETDTDPFRFVRVSDAELPAGCTRIERIFNRKRDGTDNGMQMYFEAVQPGTRFSLTLEIDPESANKRGRFKEHKGVERPVQADELIATVNAFYRGRLEAEIKRFYPGAGIKGLPSVSREFPLLLRVGRFSHFESASIDGLRRGFRPQAQGEARMPTEGSTRAVVLIKGAPYPFGWLLLAPEAGMLNGIGWSAGDRRNRPAESRRTVAGLPSLKGRRGTIAGEPAEVLSDDGAKLQVRFLNSGDIEAVSRVEFTPDE